MKKLMLLHNRMDWNANLIRKASISNGWSTYGVVSSDDLKEVCSGYDVVRYYGNTLDSAYFINPPFQFHKIPPNILEDISKAFPEYFGRECKSYKYGFFKKDTSNQIRLEEKKFVKCAYTKWFESRVYEALEPIGNEACKDEDSIYIQDLIDPIDEVRCFVSGGKILTGSFYKKNKILIDSPPEVPDEVPDILHQMTCNISKEFSIFYGVVFDFARLSDGRWVYLEINESWASGLYDCLPNKCFESIIDSQY
jgi:hypothetical protein